MASDAKLLYDWRDGNAQAGEELFERYYDSVERYFGNKVSHDPRDLIQVTFQRCVEGRDRIIDGRSFRSYLFGIACNVLRGHLRALYQCREEDLSSRSIHDLAPGPSTLLIESEELHLLARALRMLPLELQEALELHYWEGMSSTEIEHVLGIKASTVRTYLVRGRRLLARTFDELSLSKAHSTEENIDAWAGMLRQQMCDRAGQRRGR